MHRRGLWIPLALALAVPARASDHGSASTPLGSALSPSGSALSPSGSADAEAPPPDAAPSAPGGGAVEGRVVGGTPSAAGAWPDIAFVNGLSGSCTGTLIHPEWVMTAAHCLPGVATVLLGATDSSLVFASDGDLAGAERIRVVEQIPFSQNWETSFDIALLKLDKPAVIGRPRLIGRGCITDQFLAKGATVHVVGWGMTNEQGTSSTSDLMEGTTVVATPDCAEDQLESGLQTGCSAGARPAGEIGAGGEGVDACFGDSGGPLYLPTPYGTFVVGVTSRSYLGVNPGYPCRDGGIWTRPDAVIDWIEATIGEKLPAPTCFIPPQLELGEVQIATGGQRRIPVRPPDDPPEGAWVYRVLRQPLHGRVTISEGGVLTLSAHPNYAGVDSFVFGIGASATGSADDVQVSEIPVAVTVGHAGACDQGLAPSGIAALGATALLARRRAAPRP